LEDLEVDGRINVKIDLQEIGRGIWTGFIWLNKARFHKMQGIS